MNNIYEHTLAIFINDKSINPTEYEAHMRAIASQFGKIKTFRMPNGMKGNNLVIIEFGDRETAEKAMDYISYDKDLKLNATWARQPIKRSEDGVLNAKFNLNGVQQKHGQHKQNCQKVAFYNTYESDCLLPTPINPILTVPGILYHPEIQLLRDIWCQQMRETLEMAALNMPLTGRELNSSKAGILTAEQIYRIFSIKYKLAVHDILK